ncbi:MAG: hypothetical protein P8P99_04630 [Maricaulis sp.]|nr:hypothetical protein [Maricaulis sp.]
MSSSQATSPCQAEQVITELFKDELLISHSKLAGALRVAGHTLYDFGDDGLISWRGRNKRRRYAEIDVRAFLLEKDETWVSSKNTKPVRKPAKKSSTRKNSTTRSVKKTQARRPGRVVNFRERLAAHQSARHKPSSVA